MTFSYKKAVQALNYFAQHKGGSISKLQVLKLVYFADRYHLRKFGRPVTGDQYWAMQYGPVASGVKDLAELDSLSGPEQHYARNFLARGVGSHDVVSRAPVEETVFSDSDREALAFAWENYGQVSLHHLIQRTHQYPEWTRHEARLGSESRMPMSYADFLLDPPPGVDPCHALTEAERADRLEQLHERERVEALLS